MQYVTTQNENCLHVLWRLMRREREREREREKDEMYITRVSNPVLKLRSLNSPTLCLWKILLNPRPSTRLNPGQNKFTLTQRNPRLHRV